MSRHPVTVARVDQVAGPGRAERGERRGPLAMAAGLVLVAAVLAAACSGGGEDRSPHPTTGSTVVGVTTGKAGIDEAEAVRIATAEVRGRYPEFDFGARPAQVVPGSETFDVSFPLPPDMVAEGEPHVVVDRATGEVTKRYLTR